MRKRPRPARNPASPNDSWHLRRNCQMECAEFVSDILGVERRFLAIPATYEVTRNGSIGHTACSSLEGRRGSVRGAGPILSHSQEERNGRTEKRAGHAA